MPTRAADNEPKPKGYWDESPWVDVDGVYLVKGIYWQGPDAAGSLTVLRHSVSVRKDPEVGRAEALEQARSEGFRLLEAKVLAVRSGDAVCHL